MLKSIKMYFCSLYVSEIITRRYHTITKAGIELFGTLRARTNILYMSVRTGGVLRCRRVMLMCCTVCPRVSLTTFRRQEEMDKSRLLQALREAINNSYPTSDI